MRKYIISDIHGDGNVYKSIMGYLDNISKEEKIELYINGDLFDRGQDSAEVLLDVIKRIKDNKFKIIYLGGNHELLMYQIYDRRRKGLSVSYFNEWYDNGGWITDELLEENLDYDKDKILEVADFVGDLPIYHKFEEKINGKNIMLVHSASVSEIEKHPDAKIKDNDDFVNWCVWTREYDPFIPFRCRIGNDNYFSIVGHTPNNNPCGYEYNEKEDYLNIDGGCSFYVSGYFDFDHVPLVEVLNEKLRILTFNNNNEIVYGNYFINGKSNPFTAEELDTARGKINHNLKLEKLIKNEDGAVYYEKGQSR